MPRPPLLATLLLVAAYGVPSPADQTGPPNILFVITDDMQRYMFNCLPEGQGKNLTPNLDRLAAEGTIMLQQYVSAPVCTPSRFSCLTGRYASRSTSDGFTRNIDRDGQTVVGWNTKIMPGDVTLPRLLQKAGYTTGMVGKNHTIDAPGYKKAAYRDDPNDPAVKAMLEKGQQVVQDAVRGAGFDYAGAIYHNNPDGNGPRAIAVHNIDWITQAGLRFLDSVDDEPFFLYFAVTVPHGPGQADRSWNADPRATAVGFLDERPNVLPARHTIPERLEQAGLPVDNTRATMLWLDDALGALLDKLEADGRLDNTLIVFFNDHGQGAKGTLYQGGITDPSIVWRKGGFPCGGVNTTRVSNIDFTPTLLDVAGAPIPDDQFDGKSFLPSLMGHTNPIHDSLFFEMGFSRAVVKGDWKYLALRYPERARTMSLADRRDILEKYNVRQREHDKPTFTNDPTRPFSHISLIPGGGGAEAASTGKYAGYYDADQLYDLSHDPAEQHNLAELPQHAAKLEEMKRELRTYLDQLPGGFADLKQ